ncbi:MAG: beta-ketoacyl synthase N-terminal-like domain-containing protein, partial [Rhizobiaceae bacterium]
MRRVVVTGIGMVSPLGGSIEASWKGILAARSAARKVEHFQVDDLASKIACMVPLGDASDGAFNGDEWMEPKEQRKVDPFIVFAVAAATQALNDAGWHPETEDEKCATGTMIGSG